MKFETVEQKASYGIGLQIGQQLKASQLDDLNLEALKQGIADVMQDKAPTIELTELQEAMDVMHERTQAKQKEKAKLLAKEGELFLVENAKKAGVKTTDSGLQYEVLTEGTGEKPNATDKVRVHYVGTLTDGTVFDSSVARGEPAEFPLNAVIRGWTEGLQLMPVGSKYRFTIPYQLAYGEQGAGNAIPPFSTLVFEVELLDIIK